MSMLSVGKHDIISRYPNYMASLYVRGKTRGWKPVPGSQIVGKTRKTETGTRKYERVIALS